MAGILLPLLMIGVGGLHIAAFHQQWGWFWNNYQVKSIRKSMGVGGLRIYTYATCALCIGFGFYVLATGMPAS